MTRCDAVAALHQRREAGFHHPVDPRLRERRAHVLHRRHGVDHVTERRKLDDEDVHARHCGSCSHQRPGRLRPAMPDAIDAGMPRTGSMRRLRDLRVGLDAAQQRQHLRARCGAAPPGCGPRSAAPAPAWCWTRGSGRSRRASPRAAPSMVETCAGAGKSALATSCSTSACGSPSAHFTLSSGVEKLVGRPSSTALGSSWRDRISSRRRAGVGAVVEAEPALLEEDVAAHLAAQRRIRPPSSWP